MKIVLLLCLLPLLSLHSVLANGEVEFNFEDLDEDALVMSVETEEEDSLLADDAGDSVSSVEDVSESDEDLVDSEVKPNTHDKRQAMFQIYLNDIGGQNTGYGIGGSAQGGGDGNQWGNYGGPQTNYIPYDSWQYGSGNNYNMWPGSWGQNTMPYGSWGQNTMPYGSWGQNNWSPNNNWGNDWYYGNNYNPGGLQIANYGTMQGNLGSGDWGMGGGYNGGGGGGGPYILPVPYPVGGGGGGGGKYCSKSKEKKGKCKGRMF